MINGDVIINCEFASVIIPNPTKAVFICEKEDGNLVTLNEKNEEIFTEFGVVEPIEINGVMTYLPYEKSVLKYKKDGKYGIIDFNGKMLTKPLYDGIYSVKYKEGEILAKKDGKFGVINNKGKVLIPFEYDEIEADRYYSDGYQKSGYIVKVKTTDGYKYGYINSKWKKLLKTEYTSLSRILDIDDKEGIYLIASYNGQYGVIKNKKEEVDFEYQSISYNKDTELLAVQRGENYGVINMQGENVIPVGYRAIRFNGIYICARGIDKDTYYDMSGKELENDYIGKRKIDEADCYITTKKDNSYGIEDSEGNILTPNEYVYIDYAFDKYFAAYKENEGLGIIDKNNNVIVNFEYDSLNRISDKNLIKAVDLKDNITTIFSENMEKVVTMQNMSMSVYDDYVECTNGEEMVFINNQGEIKKAQDIFTNNKLFAFSENKKWGFKDEESGEIKVNPEYDVVTEFNRFGFAGVKKDGKWGVINQAGEIVKECTFTFEDEQISPEFLGKFYKTYKENGEVYYTDELANLE